MSLLLQKYFIVFMLRKLVSFEKVVRKLVNSLSIENVHTIKVVKYFCKGSIYVTVDNFIETVKLFVVLKCFRSVEITLFGKEKRASITYIFFLVVRLRLSKEKSANLTSWSVDLQT